MKSTGRTEARVAIAVVVAVLAANAIAGDAWHDMDKVDKELRDVPAELRIYNRAVALCREGLAAKNRKLKPLRKALEKAEEAKEAVLNEGELRAAMDRLRVARAARDGKVESLFTDFLPFRAAKERHAELKKKIEAMTERIAKLDADELVELARLHEEEREVGGKIYSAVRGSWLRGEVAAEFKKADEAYKAHGVVYNRSEAMKQAKAQVNAARKALNEAIAALPLDSKAAKKLLARQAELEGKVSELRKKIGGMENALVKGGKTVRAVIKVYDGRQKKGSRPGSGPLVSAQPRLYPRRHHCPYDDPRAGFLAAHAAGRGAGRAGPDGLRGAARRFEEGARTD